jgi:hypothetical protein
MSAVTIKIELPPESEATIQRFRDMPEELPKAIKRGMDRSLQIVTGRIVEKRMSGKGPFPPPQHRLGEVTGQLRRSLRAEPAEIAQQTVTGAIGTPVIYGAVHEFGFSGTVRGKGGKSHHMHMPERAPVRTGVTENTDFIVGEITDEIEKTLTKT